MATEHKSKLGNRYRIVKTAYPSSVKYYVQQYGAAGWTSGVEEAKLPEAIKLMKRWIKKDNEQFADQNGKSEILDIEI